MRVYAFQGTHYRSGANGRKERSTWIAPPYDQINDALRDRLHAQDPHQFAHLIRPVARPADCNGVPCRDPYQNAADLHRRWLAEGVIEVDAEPALYPYVIHLAGGGERYGVMALVGLEAPETGIIRPHEQTLDKPLADRLDLLRATRIDLEPALLLVDDQGWMDRELPRWIADQPAATPLVVHTDTDGHRHALHRVDDPARIAALREALADLPAAIADGHHRYKTSLLYAQETTARAGEAAAAKMAVITSLSAQHLTIDPIHRALQTFPGFDALASVATRRDAWSPAGPANPGVEFAKAVAGHEQPALGIWPSTGLPEIWTLDRSQAPPHVPESAAGLAVVLLQEVVYPKLGYDAHAATDGTVLYRNDPVELHRMVAAGEVAAGLWLPPMSPAEFGGAIAHGDLLPPKSTRFLPKVFSGLVWAGHDAKLA